MARRVRRGTFWPSEQQERLLAAALAEPGEAAKAWRGLSDGFSLDDVERGSFAVLPLVYKNLVRSAPSEPLLPKLKGIYRKTWVMNNLLAERMRAIEDVLRDGEIETLYVEGLALAERFYLESALRPTSAIDVLVHARDRRPALARLARAGWHARDRAVADGPEPRYLFDASGHVCVLRTTVAVDLVSRADGASPLELLWTFAKRETVAGTDVLVTPATDALLAVCVSHVRAAPERNVQWIVDAKMLMRTEIDWVRLVGAAAEWGQATRLREAFRYLAGVPGPPPARSALDALDELPTRRRERLAYASTAGSLRVAGTLPVYLAEHLARTHDESAVRVAATFAAHLRDRWGLASRAQVPISAARRAVRLARRRVRGTS